MRGEYRVVKAGVVDSNQRSVALENIEDGRIFWIRRTAFSWESLEAAERAEGSGRPVALEVDEDVLRELGWSGIEP